MQRRFKGIPWWQVLAAFLSAYLVWRATSAGLMFSPDGRVYLDAARSFGTIGGLWVHDPCGRPSWMNTFPPLFPIVTGIGMAIGFDALVFARLLNTICAAIAVGTTAWMVKDISQSKSAGLLAGCAVALLPDFIDAHRAFLSDPLFMALFSYGLLLLHRGIRDNSRGIVLAAAMVLGLAGAARFAGMPLVAAGALMVWRATRRTSAAAAFFLIGAIPTALVSATNVYFTGGFSDRPMSLTPIDTSDAIQGLATLSGWFRLDWLPPYAQAILAGAVLLAFGVVIVRRGFPADGPSISVVLMLAYLLLLCATHLLFDPSVGLIPRLTVPLFGPMLVVLAGLIPRACLIGLLLILAGLQWHSTIEKPLVVRAIFNSNHPSWKQSETLHYASTLQGIQCYYANSPDTVDLQLKKPSGWLPRHHRGYTNADDPDWCPRIKESLAQNRSAVFIFFDIKRGENYQVTEDELLQCLSTATRVRLSDGTVAIVK